MCDIKLYKGGRVQQMKILHLADMHFDSPFSMLDDILNIGIERRIDQRNALKKVIEYVKLEKIKYLLIAGDLYEHEYIRESTIEFINKLFIEIPGTRVFISPGNHDPFLRESYYSNYKWSENVHIFSDNLEVIETQEADIYGIGFTDFYEEELDVEKINIKNKEKINILLLHADLNGNSKYRPVSYNKINNLGFDYVALGHIHKTNYLQSKNIIYPGSAISLGFDELGEHGMIMADIEKGIVNKKFIKLDEKEFIEYNLDISEINSIEELVERINEIKINENNKIIKLIFKGIKNFNINLNEIERLITNKQIIKIKDDTKININIEKIKNENTLKGLFIKQVLNEIQDEKIKNKIIEIGLKSFEKK